MEVSIGRTWVTIVTIACLIFNAVLVVYLVLYGHGDNSLHASALSWAFATSAGVLAGLGFGSLSPLIASMVKK